MQLIAISRVSVQWPGLYFRCAVFGEAVAVRAVQLHEHGIVDIVAERFLEAGCEPWRQQRDFKLRHYPQLRTSAGSAIAGERPPDALACQRCFEKVKLKEPSGRAGPLEAARVVVAARADPRKRAGVDQLQGASRRLLAARQPGPGISALRSKNRGDGLGWPGPSPSLSPSSARADVAMSCADR